MQSLRVFVLAASGFATLAQAGIVYQTSFERPGHTVGVMPQFPPNPAVQDNWFQLDGNIFSVTNNVARSGSQSVTGNTTNQPNASRWALRATPLDGSLPENNIVESSVWVRMDPNDNANRLSRAGIDIYDNTGANRIAALGIQSDGVLRAIDGVSSTFDLATGLTLGEWYKLTITVIFSTQKVQFSLNDNLLGFGAHSAADFGDADLWMIGFKPTPDTAPGIGHQAYFDDYSIAVIPAPGTLALLGLGALAARRRRT
ncbi:MAG TPA: PEP-CTERM sorting domain-containing protein [Phycisphaerales bacterium]